MLKKKIDPNIIFADLDESETAIWSLLLMSGYLKYLSLAYEKRGIICELAVPNQEVRSLYQQIIEQWLSDGRDVDWYNEFLEALLTGEMTTHS